MRKNSNYYSLVVTHLIICPSMAKLLLGKCNIIGTGFVFVLYKADWLELFGFGVL